MLDRDEAERLPVVIPQEDIDNDPKAFAWYEGPEGGGFTVPYQFKKYPNRPVNETPMGYLHFIMENCNERTKNVQYFLNIILFNWLNVQFTDSYRLF